MSDVNRELVQAVLAEEKEAEIELAARNKKKKKNKKQPQPTTPTKEKGPGTMTFTPDPTKTRNEIHYQHITDGFSGGAHKNKGKRQKGPMRKRKHKKKWGTTANLQFTQEHDDAMVKLLTIGYEHYEGRKPPTHLNQLPTAIGTPHLDLMTDSGFEGNVIDVLFAFAKKIKNREVLSNRQLAYIRRFFYTGNDVVKYWDHGVDSTHKSGELKQLANLFRSASIRHAVQSQMLQLIAAGVIQFDPSRRKRKGPYKGPNPGQVIDLHLESKLDKAHAKLNQWEKENGLSLSSREGITQMADIQAAYSHGEWVLQKREDEKPEYNSKIKIGDGWIDEKNQIKVHRFMNWLKVWDLKDAGRRGKLVEIHSLHLPDEGFKNMESGLLKSLYKFEEDLLRKKLDITKIAMAMKALFKQIPAPFGTYYVNKEKAVRHDPVSTKPIKINGLCEIEANTQEFTVRESKDKGRDVTIITGKGREAKKFYAWAVSRMDDLKRAHLREIRDQLNKAGIKYKIYYI